MNPDNAPVPSLVSTEGAQCGGHIARTAFPHTLHPLLLWMLIVSGMKLYIYIYMFATLNRILLINQMMFVENNQYRLLYTIKFSILYFHNYLCNERNVIFISKI